MTRCYTMSWDLTSATLADLQAIERGCAGEGPLERRDQAILSILKTTAARNSSVRLLRVGDVDFERAIICHASP